MGFEAEDDLHASFPLPLARSALLETNLDMWIPRAIEGLEDENDPAFLSLRSFTDKAEY